MAIDFTGLLSGAGQAGAAYLPYAAGEGILDYLKQAQTTIPGALQGIQQGALSELQFQPFTVTSGTGGGASVGAGGGVNVNLSPEQQQLQSLLMGQAMQTAQQAPVTSEQLFSQMQALTAPAEAQRRQQLENRLFSQGRLGTQTSAYGGTPEQLALEQAIQQQQGQNMLSALTGAPALEQARLQNVGGALAASYQPEAQALSLLGAAQPFSQMGQETSLARGQLLRDLGITGLESEQALLGNIAGFEADRLRALSQALSGLFAQPTNILGQPTGTSAANSILSGLGDIGQTLAGLFAPQNTASPTPASSAPTGFEADEYQDYLDRVQMASGGF
jgi:hypothetical protein